MHACAHTRMIMHTLTHTHTHSHTHTYTHLELPLALLHACQLSGALLQTVLVVLARSVHLLRMCEHACVSVCVCVRAHACVYVCVPLCLRISVSEHAGAWLPALRPAHSWPTHLQSTIKSNHPTAISFALVTPRLNTPAQQEMHSWSTTKSVLPPTLSFALVASSSWVSSWMRAVAQL
jgi:hypothetical protein